MRLEVEREALKKEKDEFSKNRIKEIDNKLKDLKEKRVSFVLTGKPRKKLTTRLIEEGRD